MNKKNLADSNLFFLAWLKDSMIFIELVIAKTNSMKPKSTFFVPKMWLAEHFLFP